MANLELLRKNISPAITPWMDAMVHYACLGNCIYGGIGGSLSGSISGSTFTIQTGMGQAFGYQFRNSAVTTLQMTVTAGQTYQVGVSLYVNGSDESQDAMSFSYIQSLSKEPNKTEILTNGTSTSGSATFIPLWSVYIDANSANSTVETINVIDAGVAREAVNLIPGGIINGKKYSDIFNDFWNLQEITGDYQGNQVSYGITEKPGVRYSDEAGIASVCTHIGGNYAENSVDGNMKFPNGGYLGMMIPLFRNKAFDISSTSAQTIAFDNQLPSHVSQIVFIGKNGLELMRTTPLNSSSASVFFLDCYDSSDAVIKVTLGDTSLSIQKTGDSTRLFQSDEYSVLTAYAIATMGAIF